MFRRALEESLTLKLERTSTGVSLFALFRMLASSLLIILIR